MIFDYLIEERPFLWPTRTHIFQILRHWLFHWAACKYLLHICLLFCLTLSCRRYKHMHNYFMTLQIYSICNNYPTLPHGLIELFKIVNNDFTFGSTKLFPCGPSPSLAFYIIHFLLWQQSIYSLKEPHIPPLNFVILQLWNISKFAHWI